MPALLTSPDSVSRPRAAATSCAAAATAASSVTSNRSGEKESPNSRSSRSASSFFRTLPKTRKPAWVSTFAQPQPMPVETPVTTTDFMESSHLLRLALLVAACGNKSTTAIFGSRSALSIVSEPRPDLVQRLAYVPAEPKRLPRFLGHAERVVDPADRLDRAERFEVALAAAAENEHNASVRAPRPPEEVVLVRADDGRAAPERPEEVHRRRLAVVPAEEDGLRLILQRQRLISLANGFRNLRPAEHVGVILRQRAEVQLLARARLEPEGALILQVGGDRQDRHDERRGHDGAQDDERGERGLRGAWQPRLPSDGAARH